MKSFIMALLTISVLSVPVYADPTQTTSGTAQVSADKNLTDGQAFLNSNKQKPGVVALPDGLQYQVITQGKGPKPTDSDIVTVDYEGKLINGKVFDSSFKRGQPATFPVSGVIPGWIEALKLMNKGATWMLFIPASLAYGDQGAAPVIGPNETLIFKVHLIDIKQQ